MSPLALTPERRAQLGELLADERRLEAEFPKVATYLDTAAQLAGGGDAEADRAFDLRALHYMTGGSAVSDNPYWEVVAPAVHQRDGRRLVDGGNPAGSARLAYAQTVLQETYAYAIPSPETIAWIKFYVQGRRVIELGAGRGYWAAQLNKAGISIEAYEIEPPDSTDNVSFPRAQGQTEVWHPVRDLDSFDSRQARRQETILFLCWPPGWENPMASQALTRFEEAGGHRLIYIGEPQGGKTADSKFFLRLTERWNLTDTDPDFVSWWNLKDRAQVWDRADHAIDSTTQ